MIWIASFHCIIWTWITIFILQNVIVGGNDTIVVTLTWAISLLLNNRHVLKKVQDELDDQVGKERIVNESNINKLVYLQAIVRDFTFVSWGTTIRTTWIHRGLHHRWLPCPKRHSVNPKPLENIQTDRHKWSDPLKFKLERFLTTHKDVDFKGQNFEFIPFGSGRRICPGTSFGVQMVHLALASFLHMYDISTPSNVKVDITKSFGLTNLKATPLEVLITPRLHLTSFMD